MTQHDPDITVTIPPPPSRFVMVGGRRMCFEGGRILEIADATPPEVCPPPDPELARLRAAHEDLVELRQLVTIYLGTEEPRTTAGRAQAEVLRAMVAPAALRADTTGGNPASQADTQGGK
jgi:hypothetical protein